MAPKYRLVVLTVVWFVSAALLLPSDAVAQRRGGGQRSGGQSGGQHGGQQSGGQQGGGRTAGAVRSSSYRPVYSRPGYYRPAYVYRGYYAPYYYYDPFFWGWGSYGYGYGGYGGYGYDYQYPGRYYWGGTYDRTGAARLQITPKQTEVFVDGYFVGKADDFDGALQRLRVEAGEHELEFYLDGYRTAKQPVLFRREGTITIKHVMEAVTAGETSERPTPTEPPAGAEREAQEPAGPPAGYRPRPGERTPPPARGQQREDFGTLAIRVQPGDAEILIDGERWDGSDDGSRLSVELGDGPHRVEIRREGYRTYSANVRIRRGQTETLNVSLAK